MTAYEGKRFVFDGALCTVRYKGPLEGTSGEWLGVEWDDPLRGKHNGTHKGRPIFRCLSTSNTAASFLRPSRKSDRTKGVLSAIKHKYEQAPESNGSLQGPGYEIIEISKKKVEEVGFEKIKQQMSHLENLKIALVDQLNVAGLTSPDDKSNVSSAQAELAGTCPSILELDLSWNPIEEWNDILDTCTPLKKLRILKANGLRLRSMEAHQQVEQVSELHMTDCLLKPPDILDLLSVNDKPVFPNLKTLWLSQNELHSFETAAAPQTFPSVSTIVLENNHFSGLGPLADLFRHFPNVTTLSMQGNRISGTGLPESAQALSTTLASLNLASNAIETFQLIDSLPTLFPALTSLRISKNPLYDSLAAQADATSSSGRPSDSPFYLTLARLPTLTTLNYTTISPRDREEGEIYYLFVVEKEIRSKLAATPNPEDPQFLPSLQPQYPLYMRLCAKYDRPNILHAASPGAVLEASKIPSFAAGNTKSLAGRLVRTTFYLPGTDKVLEWALPRTTSVYTLKSLLARHFGLPPLQFGLVYESAELDPVQVTTTKLYGSSTEEWEAWGHWDVDVGKPGAEPVVKEMVPGADEEAEEKWVDGELLKGGTRWRRREVQVLDGMREWGDYLDGDVGDVRVRVEPWDE